MLRDRLVAGVRNFTCVYLCLIYFHLFNCLLPDSNLTFKTAYDTAVALEAAENNATLLQSVQLTLTSESVDSSSQLNRLQQSSNKTQFKYYRCGGRHTHTKDCRQTQTVCNRRAVAGIGMKIPWPQPFEDGHVRTFLKDFEGIVEAAGLDTDREVFQSRLLASSPEEGEYIRSAWNTNAIPEGSAPALLDASTDRSRT
ncbi:hypothetical protein CSKR_114483 [Clonorchis sinensis]|uniref:Uncharacterized protein n=1 Tax=Clonorchis sinensis TaxID=79923 RepID=A0A3R7FS49_CLOSI|nr:hypothetical protein CSKR_114483 [Clonorchis sinensis]